MSIKQTETGIVGDPGNALVSGTGKQELVGIETQDALKKAQADLMRARLDQGHSVSTPNDSDDYPHPTGYDPETGKYDARLENRTAHTQPIEKPAPGPQFAMGGNLSHPKAAHPRVFGPRALPPRPKG